MRVGLKLLGCALLLVTSGAATDLPSPTRDEMRAFLDSSQSWELPESDPLFAWDRDLKQMLAGSTPEQTADALAPRYGLSPRDMRELVRLWLVARTHPYDFQRKNGLAEALRARLLALVKATGRDPLVLEAAAAAIGDKCVDADYDALLEGSTSASDAWRIARERDCPSWYRKFTAAHPDQALPALIETAHGSSLDPRLELAIGAWLIGDPALSRVPEADRDALRLRLYDHHLDRLFRAGLTPSAVAILDAFPADFRNRLLDGHFPATEVQADGLPFRLAENEGDDTLRLNYAAALALAGRKDEAEAQFAALKTVGLARAWLACMTTDPPASPGKGSRCESNYQRDDANTLLLDQLLHHPGEDPYLLAETFFAGSSNGGGARGVLAELRCRIFAEPRFGDLCESARWLTAAEMADVESGDKQERADALAVVQAAKVPGLDALSAEFAPELAALVEAGGGEAALHRYNRREQFEAPVLPPFEQRPLPPEYRGRRASVAKLPGSVKLPEGFFPVRFERSGRRLVVVSTSQNLDPTGEVSSGGYWLHLSEDGGKRWQAPLYTGLAEYFPYVVADKSEMPLLDGDTLNLAVDIAELDPASITYPPVGLRTRRSERDLYLRIPLAELGRDSDGDGLTDLAAAHLLLDPTGKQAPGSTPAVVGASAAQCHGAPNPERRAMMALLTRIFSVKTGAIVEPVDRAPDAPLMSGWRSGANGWDRPIFVQGDPADYACMRPDRLMIVYSEADMARLRRSAPDFHAVTLDKVIYNRARDRGYVKWSAGWTGGTIRLRWRGDAWALDDLSSWIT